jgi:hypothetical protein
METSGIEVILNVPHSLAEPDIPLRERPELS